MLPAVVMLPSACGMPFSVVDVEQVPPAVTGVQPVCPTLVATSLPNSSNGTVKLQVPPQVAAGLLRVPIVPAP